MLAVALMVVFTGVAARPAWAQKKTKPVITTVRVSVTVLDPKGKPLSGAGVVLRQETVDVGRMSKNPFNVEIHTDDKGVAQVQGFEPGIVLVQVIAHGYQTYGQAFVMKDANETVQVKLKPPRSQVTIYK